MNLDNSTPIADVIAVACVSATVAALLGGDVVFWAGAGALALVAVRGVALAVLAVLLALPRTKAATKAAMNRRKP